MMAVGPSPSLKGFLCPFPGAVTVDYIMTAHFLLGTTSEGCVSTLDRART